MPIRGIRMIAFLTLAVLAPGCSCVNCSCRCNNVYSCHLITPLETGRVVDKDSIQTLGEKTKANSYRLEKVSEEKAEVATNISALAKAVDELRNKSEDVSNRVEKLKNDTSNRFNVTDEKRNRLGEDMKEFQRKSAQQRDDLAERLRRLERLYQEAQLKWRDQENKTRNLLQEIAAKSEEERRRTLEVSEEFMKQVEEAENQTMDSKTEVLNRLKNSEDKLKETDHFIEELIQKVNATVPELSRTVQKTTTSLTVLEMKSDNLQEKIKKVKRTVPTLLTSQSELKEEIRTNLSLSAERLKTDIEGRLIKLKHLGGNLTKKINQIEETQLMLAQELSKCALLGSLSELDREVREHARASNVEHQSLRSEMSGNVTKLLEQCAARDDFARVQQNVTFLSTDLEKTRRQLQEVRDYIAIAEVSDTEELDSDDNRVSDTDIESASKEAGLKPNCKDTAPEATCEEVVRNQMCKNKYSGTRCCASCAKAP